MFEDVPGGVTGGKVNVIHGSAGGPRIDRLDTVAQESGAIPGSSERGDSFGYEVSLGDMDRDGGLSDPAGRAAGGRRLAGGGWRVAGGAGRQLEGVVSLLRGWRVSGGPGI
ncbi:MULTISPECIES: hypothetical protein [Streptomyces]|uniref:Uncharacterized protein n=1 Tax=Streptomyces siderophoricus TaxID=2802281 RepID=A0ABS1MVW2_9ACTN|nr:hypothetical protein [Streptomyces sp. 9-7]MBL1091925.1 hypothetical protein [Streptomyces sp. 9-7]